MLVLYNCLLFAVVDLYFLTILHDFEGLWTVNPVTGIRLQKSLVEVNQGTDLFVHTDSQDLSGNVWFE